LLVRWVQALAAPRVADGVEHQVLFGFNRVHREVRRLVLQP
jgi:hypothetical protein